MIATDLFEQHGQHFLQMVDYFSRYPEVSKLSTTTLAAVITTMKGVFARHRIPEVVRSHNGPQYSSHEFALFADSYGFQHSTSSPYFAQSNGQAERMVQTVKRLLSKCSDPFMAILTYRVTPLAWCGLSPAELGMGREIRTTIPRPLKHLVPTWGHLKEFQKTYTKYKEKQKSYFDQRHRAREALDIPNDRCVGAEWPGIS